MLGLEIRKIIFWYALLSGGLLKIINYGNSHVRIQEFLSGGPGQSDRKNSDNFFFFYSPQLLLQKSNG